ncbi:acetyl-CoA C-acetyltransferase [Nocardioides humi]|uniref:acetyl-CoA C-acyltransferase n=1 Tax=Nocardioides humi TaxID=449461 RepID=A0ABN2B2M4_9ACTN|nr:acetyl-CoA C-acetyltransferase [Nocardioides humi]
MVPQSRAVVVAAGRSPIGRARKGSLTRMRPDDLLAQVIRAVLDEVPSLDATTLDDLMVGCAQPAGEAAFNLARATGVQLGLDSVPGVTVNRFCASSLQTTRMAMHAINAGEGSAYVSAGVETVSRYDRGTADGWPDTRNPFFAEARDRSAVALKATEYAWDDPRERGWVPDLYMTMGQTAENVAVHRNVSREAMDEFAARSQQRAVTATEAGFFQREIIPVTLPDGTVVDVDDCPRPGVSTETLASLQPAFRPGGRVTAGNCCPLNDGAAALVVMDEQRALSLGLMPLARLLGSGLSGLSPEIMGLGPVEACTRAMASVGMSVGDIDLVEMNEAFAAQVIPSYEQLGIDLDRLNVNGGAIALGHPFGMTGARLVTTLINGLRSRDETIGMATMCVGGGQGMALVLERLA